jgi:hypothetical protein
LDLKQWEEEHDKLITFSIKKVAHSEKIDMLKDLVPEFKDLRNKTYAFWIPPGDPETAEKSPINNLGTLLSFCIYDHIIVPISPELNKASFAYKYGLSKERGCRVSFDQFLNFVRDGKLKLILTAHPKHYSQDFLKQIFKACEQGEAGYFPPSTFRIADFSITLKMAKLAISDGVELTKKGWIEIATRKHPEYGWHECKKDITKTLNDVDLEDLAKIQDIEPSQNVLNMLTTDLQSLRVLGFERTAQIAFKCLQLCPELGFYVFSKYSHYLVDPIFVGLLGFSNYCKEDIQDMLLLRMIPEDLGYIWKDLLSSPPASSSILSPQVTLNTIELYGDELVRFVDVHAEEELKDSVKKMNTCLARFDGMGAMESFERFDEIVSESFNKEVRSLLRKGQVTANILQFGKSFLDSSARFTPFLAAAMAATGQFQWLPAIFFGSVAAKYAEHKLNEIKPEDIVKWLSDIWPFSDPGLPITLWYAREKVNHPTKKRHPQNIKHPSSKTSKPSSALRSRRL